MAGKPLLLNPSVFDGKHGTVLDSGTTYAYLPEAAFIAFKNAIMKELQPLKQISGPDPTYNDICFSGAGSEVLQLSKTFPAVEMVFGNDQKVSLSPENYLFRHSKVHGAYCLGIFQNGKDPTTLLGGVIVRNTLVMYDREHLKIGFWKTNCSELWERLRANDSSTPMPSASDNKNSSLGTPPVVAPSGPANDVLPGGFQVGQITFYMSLAIKYSDLKPHIAELSQFIAHELDVNASQVHILSFASEGNYSLIRWAISPASPAGCISNATASSIISRLADHRVRLPDRFGSYQLLEWNAEPPGRRTWWQQHYMVIIVGIVIIVFLGLSVSGLWFLWKRSQQSLLTYKPVDSIIPEQELQPL